MADDLSKRGHPDSDLINVDEPWELRYWADKLKVTERKLKRVVQEVGPSAKKVRAHLGI